MSDKRKLFFNNDSRATAFLAANFPSNDYTKCQHCDNHNLKGIMRTQFMDGNTEEQKKVPDSIHQDFTDFIAKTALFHRTIDQPTAVHSAADISGTSNNLTKYCRDLFNSKCQDYGIKSYGLTRDAQTNCTQEDTLGSILINLHNNAARTNKDDGGLQLVHIFQMDDPATAASSPELPISLDLFVIYCIFSCISLSPKSSDLKQRLALKLTPAVQDRLIVNLTQRVFPYGSGESVSNITRQRRGNGIYDSTDGRYTREDVINVIDPENNVMADAQGNQQLAKLVDLVVDITIECFNGIKNKLGPRQLTASTIDEINSTINEILSKRSRELDFNMNLGKNPATIVRNVESNALGVEYMQGSSEVKKFIKTFMNVIDTITRQIVPRPGMQDPNRAHYRINLKKDSTDRTGQTTVFQTVIPNTPQQCTIWFTNHDGQLTSMNNCNNDILRTIYRDIYNTGVWRGENGTGIQPQILPDTPFRINHVYNITKLLQDKADSQLTGTVFDLVTNATWHRDSNNNLYKIDSQGNRVPVDNSITAIQNSISSNCFGSSLSSNNNSIECQEVFNCLVNDDTTGLNKCLANLNGTHFQHAINDAQNVNPYTVIHVLKKVGVKMKRESVITNNGVEININKAMDVSEWLDDMDDKVKNAISSNQDFVNYIKGLIAWVNQNPEILNKGLSSTNTNVSNIPNTSTGLKMWVPINRKNSLQTTASMLRLLPPIGYNKLGPNKLSYLPFTNTSLVSPTQGLGPTVVFQQGGNHPSTIVPQSHVEQIMNPGQVEYHTSFQIHRQIIENIKKDLSTIGFKLSDNDNIKINSAIQAIKKQEDNLIKLHNVLHKLIGYARINNIDCKYDPSPKIKMDVIKSQDLSNIKSEADLTKYIQNNIQELHRCINNANRINCGVQNDLLHKVVPELILAPTSQKYTELEM